MEICGAWRPYLGEPRKNKLHISLSECTLSQCRKRSRKKMVSELIDETEIQAPAAKVWELYGTVEFGNFLLRHVPNVVQKIEFLEGNGGEGTLLYVTFAPG